MNRRERRRAHFGVKNPSGPTILCDSHGRVPWRMDFVCETCGAIWQARSAAEPRFAPGVCTCGADFVPKERNAPENTYSARQICGGCAKEFGAQAPVGPNGPFKKELSS